jgi:hypothetical protein
MAIDIPVFLLDSVKFDSRVFLRERGIWILLASSKVEIYFLSLKLRLEVCSHSMETSICWTLKETCLN